MLVPLAGIDDHHLLRCFRHNRWLFRPLGPDACEIEFAVEFTFRNALFQKLANQYLDKAFRKMVGAFEQRAAQIYGSSSSSAQSVA